MEIRCAEETDAKSIQSLIMSLSHYYLDGKNSALPKWLKSSLALSEVKARISSALFKNYICEIDDKVVAYLSIKEESHLYHLFVDEAYQGQGLSRKLWEYGKQQTHSDTFTLRSSLNAISVYKKFGFVENGSVLKRDGVSFQPMVLEG